METNVTNLKKVTIQDVAEAFASAEAAMDSANAVVSNSSALLSELYVANMYGLIVKGAELRITSAEDQKKETVRVRAVLAKVRVINTDEKGNEKAVSPRLTIVEQGRKTTEGSLELDKGEKFILYQKPEKVKDENKALLKAIEKVEENVGEEIVANFIERLVTVETVLAIMEHDEEFAKALRSALRKKPSKVSSIEEARQAA